MSDKKTFHGSSFYAASDVPGCSIPAAETSFTGYWNDGVSRQQVSFSSIEASADQFEISLTPTDREDLRFDRLFTRAAALEETWKTYCRISPKNEAGDQWDQNVLKGIAEELTRYRCDVRRPEAANIPAAYTYFGQFIAHEISDIANVNEAERSLDARTAALDLDSLFSNRNFDRPGSVWCGGVGVGKTHPKVDGEDFYSDLPRDDYGVAEIPEVRNDHNLGVAQMHTMIAKFHQINSKSDCAPNNPEHKRKTMRHIQSIVVSDYMKRIIDPAVYYDVLDNGRKLIRPGIFDDSIPYLIPIEFAAACFRVGHCMVRDTYFNWGTHGVSADLADLMNFTNKGGSINSANSVLDSGWPANWRSLLHMAGANSGLINYANSIDFCMNQEMGFLDKKWFSHDVHEYSDRDYLNLGYVTMLRGEEYELKNAQDISMEAGRTLLPCLSPKELLDRRVFDEPYYSEISKIVEDNGIHANTPLWFYCLMESKYHHSGLRLGPYASRIVFETIHASIEASEFGIIDCGKNINFTETECISGREAFSLADLAITVESWTP